MSTNATDAHDTGSKPVAQARVPVNIAELDRECALRGWNKQRLADAMGVRRETVWTIYRDSSAAPGLFARLTEALEANPASEIAARLLGDSTEGAA